LLITILLYAASRITSIFDACQRLAAAPSDQALRDALRATLPPINELERRLNAGLAADLPKALRKGRHTMAFDLTLIPYHGEPYRSPEEIYRGEPKSGTSHFHAYATAYIVRHGRRFTVAVTRVLYGEPIKEVLRRLLQQASRIGVKPRYLLLDRGFYSVEVVRYLQAARYPFLMPAAAASPATRRNRKASGGSLPGSAAAGRSTGGATRRDVWRRSASASSMAASGSEGNLDVLKPWSMPIGAFVHILARGSAKPTVCASPSKLPTDR
jgi:putative transposase